MQLVENEVVAVPHSGTREEREKTKKTSYGSVSSLYRCQTKDATKLAIYDTGTKIGLAGYFDIGGTYTEDEPDFWFYYSTSWYHANIYFLNLFVCHRKPGNFSIGIAEFNQLLSKPEPKHPKKYINKQYALTNALAWFTFTSTHSNQTHYIKTFEFTSQDCSKLNYSTLFIPIRIKHELKLTLSNGIIRSIKLQHNFGNILSKEKSDFVLLSESKKEYPTHKIIIAAHSPVLRDLVKNAKMNTLFIDIPDSDMDLLLQFLYEGSVENLLKQDYKKLLKIAGKFQLEQLFELTQYVIDEQINVNNAVEIALEARKYNLEKIQNKVFNFIKNNPNVMKTTGWKDLKDVELTKCLLQYMHVG